MSRFYIKSIGASGPKVEYSQVTFDEGVNILHGPSNSGKSYVINCINFMFGASEVPFTRESTGYNTIHMTLESLDARTVQMTRRIIDDKNGKKSDMGDNLVTVVSNFDEVGSYDYSILKLEYSDMLLKLMGIDERHQIISTQAFVQQNLTNRSFLHSYFIDEDNIYEKIPAFDIPRHSKITACLTALHFLFTGEDLHEIVPAESKKDRELKEAKKNAVIIYINEKMGVASYETGSGFSGWTTKADESKLNPLFIQIKDLLAEGKQGVLAWDTSLEAEPAAVHNEQVQTLFADGADINEFIDEHKAAINGK